MHVKKRKVCTPDHLYTKHQNRKRNNTCTLSTSTLQHKPLKVLVLLRARIDVEWWLKRVHCADVVVQLGCGVGVGVGVGGGGGGGGTFTTEHQESTCH